MKKKLFSLAVVCICLSIVSGGTLAYYTAEETAHNVITSGNVDIALLETALDANDNPTAFENVTGVMPGKTVSKIVQVKNTGKSDAYIRIEVTKAIELAKGQEGEVNLDLLHIEFDEKNWTEKGEYYYYNKPLEAGETTEPLFESVKFDTAMGNLYQNSKATVHVAAQATQVANNGDGVFAAQGWPTNSQEGK